MPILFLRQSDGTVRSSVCPREDDPGSLLANSEQGYHLPRGQSAKARVIRGAAWSLLAMVFAQGLGFVAYVIAARVLNAPSFGEFGIIQSTVGMLGTFAGMGLGLTATKHVAEFQENQKQRAGRLIALSLGVVALWGAVMAIGLWLASGYVAAHAFGAPRLAPELRTGSLMLLFMSVGAVQSAILTGFEAFRTNFCINALRGVVNLLWVSIGAWRWGLHGAVWGLTGTAIISVVAGQVGVMVETRRRSIPIFPKGVLAEISVIWEFSLPAFISGGVAAIASWAVRAMLVHQPGGFHHMAIFTIATRFQDALNIVGIACGAALLPVLASARDHDRNDELERGNILLPWVLGAAATVPLLCFPEAAGLLFGAQYEGLGMEQSFVLVLVSTVFLMFRQGLARALAAKDMMWWGAFNNIQWAVALCVGSWYLLPYGARGLCAALVVAYGLSTVTLVPYCLKSRLVPKGVLLSKAAASVWIIVLLLAVASWMRVGLVWRVALLTTGGVGLGVAFWRMRKSRVAIQA